MLIRTTEKGNLYLFPWNRQRKERVKTLRHQTKILNIGHPPTLGDRYRSVCQSMSNLSGATSPL